MNILEHIKCVDMIVMETSIFELNDAKTRSFISFYIEDYLKRVVKLTDFIIVCDERNNTPNIVDENILRFDIALYLDNCHIHIFRHQLINRSGVPTIEVYDV